jgi:hypothetical protein
MEKLAKFLKVEDRESLGIHDIIHSEKCVTARYSDMSCYEDDPTRPGEIRVAKVGCLLVRTRAAIDALKVVKP